MVEGKKCTIIGLKYLGNQNINGTIITKEVFVKGHWKRAVVQGMQAVFSAQEQLISRQHVINVALEAGATIIPCEQQNHHQNATREKPGVVVENYDENVDNGEINVDLKTMNKITRFLRDHHGFEVSISNAISR